MIVKALQTFIKFIWYIFSIFTLFLFILFSIFFVTNTIIYFNSQSISPPIYPKEFAIVLGASVHGDALSGALKARMQKAIELYNKKLVKNILMSGDGTDSNYSETSAMKKFALKNGIPQDALLTDEKGYSTYATILRAKEVFNLKSAYIISQDFHLKRAVWIAREVGIQADGVSAGNTKDKWYYYVREFFARTKDYFQVIFKVTPYDEKNFFF
ncbi:SanA/YdcF family protein [Silvanigrella aquatica]|uniref:DUF218 domain-containing protein n=1 Tax=Silvanigrella aquatica TaxID=1915309 RepID=A0A1L4D1N3_9BACT|nr:YdcF family protein [Silvanigrella aquatica]APJ04106.1 hypothetical protein AXG55_09375 [Silvanigrella aquatica]